MDKYEFNIKVDQIKKMVTKGDYETAMKIADGIDWSRVRSSNLLSMAASVYEKNKEYQEAKDILLLAYERAPISKRLLYKLAELAVKEGNIKEAEDYYREFCDLSPDDPRQHILRYLILGAKGAPITQLIHTLEQYCSEELDEKWLYELAELYNEADMEQLCTMTCDKIMLMFGLGKYVDKAMELKLRYAPLTQYQMDLVENRDKYEARLKAVEEEYQNKTSYVLPVGEESEEDSIYGAPEEEEIEEEAEVGFAAEAEPDFEEEEVREAETETAAAEAEEEELPEEEEEEELPETSPGSEEEIRARLHEEAVRESLAREVTKLSDTVAQEEPKAAQTRVLTDIRHLTRGPVFPGSNHLMIEAENSEDGLRLAVKALKKIHQETGKNNPVAKISGEKLNKKGIFALTDKLTGKDLIIEAAGDMTETVLQELNQLMARDETGMNVVLIDTPSRLEELHRAYPGLAKCFECIGTLGKQSAESVPAAPAKKAIQKQEPVKKAVQKPAMQPTPVQKPVVSAAAAKAPEKPVKKAAAAQKPVPAEPVIREPQVQEKEMDIDEFAKYACEYAVSIDCSISGKSMLALYERIEIMEEDGIRLTKAAAEDLIEEAADKAENPSFLKKIKGLFSSKYNKEGHLILKEEHFL